MARSLLVDGLAFAGALLCGVGLYVWHWYVLAIVAGAGMMYVAALSTKHEDGHAGPQDAKDRKGA